MSVDVYFTNNNKRSKLIMVFFVYKSQAYTLLSVPCIDWVTGGRAAYKINFGMVVVVI